MTDKTNPDGFPRHEAPIDGSLFGARTTERTTLPMESGADPEGNAVRRRPRGVAFNRHYTRDGVNPFDAVEWTLRTAVIATDKGEVLFRQDNCEIPAEWTQMAANVVVSKYFRGGLGSPDREHSVRQLVGRVDLSAGVWNPGCAQCLPVAVAKHLGCFGWQLFVCESGRGSVGWCGHGGRAIDGLGVRCATAGGSCAGIHSVWLGDAGLVGEMVACGPTPGL